MHTVHLHQTLSPQAYAALIDGIHRQASRERRLAVRRFGRSWGAFARTLARRLVPHRVQTVPAVRLLEG